MALVYLARHGRTALNAAGALRGRLDPPLDDVGRQEAERLAELVLASRGPVAAVVSSPLRRATETARVVAELTGRKVDVDPGLIDRDYGEWAGRSRAEVVARWGTLDAAPGVEDAAQLRARARSALDAAAARGGDEGAVVVVAHDVVNRLLLVDIDPALGPPEALPQATGCCNVLERRGDLWLVAAVGVVSPGEDGGTGGS